MFSYTPHAAASSQAASPPTLAQLGTLTAIPSGIAAGRPKKPRRVGRKAPLAKEGQIVSQSFDAIGRRPFPTNGLSLEQSITSEFMLEVPNYMASVATAGAFAPSSRSFALSDFASATAYLGLFDQYRFEQIEVWISLPAVNGTSAFPTLYSCVDLDDANSPSGVGQIQDHMGAIITDGPAGHYHKWKPHMAVAAYSGVFTSFSNMPPTWIDSASPAVQHYGLKSAFVSNGGAFSCNLTIRAVVSFRAPGHA